MCLQPSDNKNKWKVFNIHQNDCMLNLFTINLCNKMAFQYTESDQLKH